jgi:RHS repeat-associated protein
MNKNIARLGLGVLVAGAIGAQAATQTRTTAFEYDPASGLLTKEIIEPDDPNLCLVTTYSYDAYGNKTGTTTRNCNGSSSEAAVPTGDAVFETRTATTAFAAGSVLINGTTYTWSAGQFPTTSTNALGHSETNEFDPRFGAVTKLIGPNGLVTTWTYDGFGRKASQTRSDGTLTAWTYTRCVDSPGTCPTYGEYFVTVTSTGAPQSRKFLDGLNREIRSETEGFDGVWVRKDTQYDSLGRVAQVSKSYRTGDAIAWTTYAYDNLGRVTEVNEPASTGGTGGRVRTATTYNGLLTTVTVSNAGSGANMPAGSVQTKTTTKNSQGQVVEVKDTQNNTITYTHDPFGNLLTTNAGGVSTTLTYDLRGRKLTMADPDMGNWQYFYNALGELIRQTDAKNQTTTMVYDKLGRMTRRTEPDLVSNWYHDTLDGTSGGAHCGSGSVTSKGKLCKVTSDNGYQRTHGYDTLGRPSSLTVTVDTSHQVLYSYDSAGRLDTTTYPTGFATKNLYNAYGYLWKVQRTNDPDTTVYWQANSQDAAGHVSNELLGSGLTTTRTYDALFRPTELKSVDGGGNAVHRLLYTFDAIGNVTQRQDSTQNVTENFAYDVLNRLTGASGPGLTTRSFDYNAIGNMTYKSDVGTYIYPAVTAARPHAVSSINGGGVAFSVTATYTYDANGNLTDSSGTLYPATGSVAFSRTLTYTSYNHPSTLTHAQGGSTYSYTYTYNAEHERVKLVTVRPTDTLTSIYLHPAGKGALLYEKETRQSDGVIEHKHYVSGGSGLIGVFVTKSSYATGEGPAMRYYHRDHLGSIVAISNSSGAVVERLAFEAFGERRFPNGSAQDRASPLFGINTDRGFTAHEHLDEMNLIHMNGRVYDPVIARFVTADPIVASATDHQSYNRYSYVNNNPLAYTDPSGYFKLKRLFRATVAVAAIVFAPEISAWAVSTLGPAGVGFSAAVAKGIVGGAIVGYVIGGDVHSTLAGGIGGGLFGFAGDLAGAAGFREGTFGRALFHGVAGGVMAAAQGGDFANGFVSAGAAQWIGPNLGDWGPIGDGMKQAALGGTFSALGGGKFSNGAITAAYGYMFNCGAHDCLNRRYSNLPPELRKAALEFSNKVDASGDPELKAVRDRWTLTFEDMAVTEARGRVPAEACGTVRTCFYKDALRPTEYGNTYLMAHEFAHHLTVNQAFSRADPRVTPNYEAHADGWAIRFLGIKPSQPLPRGLDYYFQNSTTEQRRLFYPGRD